VWGANTAIWPLGKLFVEKMFLYLLTASFRVVAKVAGGSVAEVECGPLMALNAVRWAKGPAEEG
jgi:hypothetical protein